MDTRLNKLGHVSVRVNAVVPLAIAIAVDFADPFDTLLLYCLVHGRLAWAGH